MPSVFLEWSFWYIVGGALVLVAAALLVTILLVARGIEKEAARALRACRDINENTNAIWELEDARERLEQIRDGAMAIEEKAGLLARTLHGGAAGVPKADG